MARRKSLRIGVDGRCLIDGKRTGVEEYAINLLENLIAQDKDNTYIFFINSFREPKGKFDMFSKYKNVKIVRFSFPNKLLNLFFWYLNWPHVDKMLGGLDLFFMPNINFVGLSKETPLVLTVHDLSFEIMPEMYSFKRRLWHLFINPKKLCKRAWSIVAVSDSTKNDLIERYGIDSEKIKRIYSGISDKFEELGRNDKRLIDLKEKLNLPYKFIYCLSTIEPRKNIPSLVKAFDALKKEEGEKQGNLHLVIAGNKGWKTEETISAMQNSTFTDDIIFLNGITDEEKILIYNLATVFVYPSFMEGFGFPALEAMKCGLPVVTSNTSSLPEIVGSEGILIDPERPDEIKIAIKNILEDKNLNTELKARGKRRALRFSWKESAKEFHKKIISQLHKNKT